MRLILAFFISLPVYAVHIKDKYITAETYPNDELTPGEVFPDVTAEKVCVKGYAQSVRNVSKGTKKQIKQQYNIEPRQWDLYSIDHFIPLSLGGSNGASNLWAQRTQGIVYGADQKTQADNYLFQEVCEGRMRLAQAQRSIQKDWVRVYLSCCSQNKTEKPKHKRMKGRKGDFSMRSDALLDELRDIDLDYLRDVIDLELELIDDEYLELLNEELDFLEDVYDLLRTMS